MNNTFIGQTINERYRLDSLLGDGGMGSVYRAFDQNLQRKVAIKLMHGHFARQEEFRQRLVQEAQTAARLDNPSIVQIYDFGSADIGPFIAMEYVEGGSLREHLQRLQRLNKYLPFNQSLQIGIQIAEALDYAHKQGVIHRDVKPGNILLKRLSHPDEVGAQPFRAKLTDFGLVKLIEGSPMTQSGATVGTPTYMSPEQCEGDDLDGRSDLYSFGIVMYELVTNRLPFAFQTLADAISTHRRGVQPSPASEYRSDAPQLINSFLAKALAKSPEDRFTSGYEMAQALRAALIALEGAPTRVMMRQELDILDEVEQPPDGYELHILTPNHPSSVVHLTQSVFTLGRNADNDIVLPAEGVSRHHTRLQATSLGWEVVDLGGTNGTWIDSRRLRPNEPAPISPGSTIRIGPYELTLQGPEIPQDMLLVGATLAAAVIPGIPTEQPPRPTVPLGVFAAQETFVIEPEKSVEIRVEVTNHSDLDDRVTLRVSRIPPEWIQTPPRFVAVKAGESIQQAIVIRVPKTPKTPSGLQRMKLQLVSQRYSAINVAIVINLNVQQFVAFTAKMEPEHVKVPADVTVTVQNVGNAAGYFVVTAHDPTEALRFFGEKGRISLQPTQVASVPLRIEAADQPLLGASETIPFAVNVGSRQTGKQILAGEADVSGRIPSWLMFLLLFLVTVACVFVGIAAVINWTRGSEEVATPVAPVDSGATVLNVVGDVRVQVGDEETAVTPGRTILADSTITTGGDGQVTLILADQSTLFLTENGSLTIVKYATDPNALSQSSIFKLNQGDLLLRKPGPGNLLQVQGQNGSNIASLQYQETGSSAARPTHLGKRAHQSSSIDSYMSVRVTDISVLVSCFTGQCRLLDIGTVLPAGMELSVTTNGITSAPTVITTASVSYQYWQLKCNQCLPSLEPVATTTATTTATIDPNMTGTPSPLTPSPTVDLASDNDGDGLSNGQEVLIGTDPNNWDTDGDRLSDGQEVKTYGTQPLNPDTDRDRLDDGDEVLVYFTKPTQVDTDQDSYSDGVEVLDLGSNPLDPNDPLPRTPTPTPTSGNTATATATFVVPPTATNTPMVTIVASSTPTQISPNTATPTFTPLPPDTATPTNTPTPLPPDTATPTNTPTPLPADTATSTNTSTPLPADTATPTNTPTDTPIPVDTPTEEIPATIIPSTSISERGLANLEPVFVCETAVSPTLDGKFSKEEWPSTPMITLGQGQTQLFGQRDAAHLYIAYLVNTTTYDTNDAVNLFIDTLNNDLLDNTDRRFVVARDGRTEIWAGDKSGWNTNYSSSNWDAVTGELSDGWVVEISINISAEMPLLMESFGIMAQSQTINKQIISPNMADYNIPYTWQDVSMSVCGE